CRAPFCPPSYCHPERSEGSNAPTEAVADPSGPSLRSGRQECLNSQPVLVFDDLPVGVLGADLAAAEGVDVATLVVQVLAVAALAAHGPHRDRAVAGIDVLFVIPAHVGNDLEASSERLADGLAPTQRAADWLGSARQPEGRVLGEER